MSTNTTIYTGFWTNWSKGSPGGATLTLSKSNGNILIIALAIFIQITGGQSWSIIRFATHQIRTTTRAKDGIHHQQQAVLRNSTSDISTLWYFMNIGWRWRSFRRSLGPISIGLIHLLAFGATSFLASHITTVGNQVLVARSSSCGPWNSDEEDDPVWQVAYEAYSADLFAASRQYVSSCLAEQQSLPECDTFKARQLNWTSSRVSCPFDELCLGPANASLYMDTGLVDSRHDLGINGPDQDRVQIRRTATCAPITTDGYTTTGTSYQLNTNGTAGPVTNTTFNYTALFYGPTIFNLSDGGLTDPALQNVTYIYTNFRDVATHFWNYEISPYDIHVESASFGDIGFYPLPAFHATNKSLSLIFASFYGVYTEPSDDLWLSAHQETSYAIISNSETDGEAFGPDNKVSVLACIEQFQLCNPSPPNNSMPSCTPWLDGSQVVSDIGEDAINSVMTTKRQIDTAQAISVAVGSSDIYRAVFSSKLLADAFASEDGVSLPLPSDQWILETQNWFSIGLANAQRYILNYITGPPFQYTDFIMNKTEVDQYPSLVWLCENLVIRRNDFTNFSTLAISIIFGLGVLVIITSLWLETIVGHVRSTRKRGWWRQRAWLAEGTLQLQRRNFEEIGIRGWESGKYDIVPVAKNKERTWSAFGDWDEMLPILEARENREVSASSPKHGLKQLGKASEKNLYLVSSKNTLYDMPTRVRSNSV